MAADRGMLPCCLCWDRRLLPLADPGSRLLSGGTASNAASDSLQAKVSHVRWALPLLAECSRRVMLSAAQCTLHTSAGARLWNESA